MTGSIRRVLSASQNPYRDLDLSWRARIRRLDAGVEHLPIIEGPRLFWHIVSVSPESPAIDWSNQQLTEAVRYLPLFPGGRTPSYSRINTDGYLSYRTVGNKIDRFTSYYQVFWDGCIEVCDTTLLAPFQMNDREVRQVHLDSFETHFFNGLKTALQFYDRMNQLYPVRVYIALTGVKGFAAIPSRRFFLDEAHLIDRNQITFEPVLMSDRDADIGKTLQPLFNQLWNAGGYARSLSYDENGLWNPQLS